MKIKELGHDIILHSIGKPDLTVDDLQEIQEFEQTLKRNGISYVKSPKHLFRHRGTSFEFSHVQYYHLDETGFIAWRLIK